ncbi:MAG: nucleotidyltransferase domain-containing protein [Thermoproteota archaeon]
MNNPVNIGEFKYRRISVVKREALLQELKRILEKLDDVLFAYIYGSFIEREFFRDVDVAVWINNSEEAFRHEVELSSKLEAELGIPIDIHVFNEAPLPFKYVVFTKGRLLFSKDEEVRWRIIDKTVRQYADLRMLRSQIAKYG